MSMIRRSSLKLALVAGALLSSLSHAEVRVVRGDAGLVLDERPSPTGPWGLVGTLDASVVNPEGDALGDGAPSFAASGDGLVAAWVRASGLRVLRATGVTEWREDDVAADAVPTQPVVLGTGDGWVVAWQEEGVRMMCGDATSALGDVVDVADGQLLGGATVNGLACLLTRPAKRDEVVLTPVVGGVAGEPVTVARGELVGYSVAGASLYVLTRTTPSGKGELVRVGVASSEDTVAASVLGAVRLINEASNHAAESQPSADVRPAAQDPLPLPELLLLVGAAD